MIGDGASRGIETILILNLVSKIDKMEQPATIDDCFIQSYVHLLVAFQKEKEHRRFTEINDVAFRRLILKI